MTARRSNSAPLVSGRVLNTLVLRYLHADVRGRQAAARREAEKFKPDPDRPKNFEKILRSVKRDKKLPTHA